MSAVMAPGTAAANGTALANIPTTVESLRAAFRSAKTQSYRWRRQQLKRLRALVVEREADIADALRGDLGKSRFEAWAGDSQLVVSEIDYALRRLKTWMKPRPRSTPLQLKPADAFVQPEPLGVVMIFGAWNYPFQLVFAPLVGALAAGNCVLLKPSEVAAASSALIARLVPRYLDRDCVAVVEGGPEVAGRLLEERFDHIFYTGNGNVGRIVMSAAAKHLTPVTLELGGKSPCIVDDNVDIAVAARRICFGKFFNAGQTCIAPDYVLVHRRVEQQLTEALTQTIRSFYGDRPAASAELARIVNQRHYDRLAKLLDGQQVVVGGLEQADREQRFLPPTLVRNPDPESPLMQEEIFGPILPIVAVDSMYEAIRFVAERPKPLALYLFTNDQDTEHLVLERTSSGGACVNETLMHIGVAGAPFGGVGSSGMGSYHGRYGFETFSHRRTVLRKSLRFDPALRYPPYSEATLKLVRRLG
jgi:aldehyde dehydrogenase (NAD+)